MLSLSATARAMMSLVPPGGSGITSVIGRVGQVCAAVGEANPISGSTLATILPMIMARVPSFRLDAGRLHQLRPHRHFAVDDGGVFLRRRRLRLGAFDR